MEAASAPTPADLVPAMKHFVKNDPFDEEKRHLDTVQRGMDADDAVLDRKTSHLDGPLVRPKNRRPPSDLRVQRPLEIPLVQAIEDLLEVVDSVRPPAVSPGAAGAAPD